MPPLTITILYNKSNEFGLKDDAEVIERLILALAKMMGPIQKPRWVDMREPLVHTDLQIHLEIPIFSAIPWAHTNIILVNPEQWCYSFDAYIHAFDALLFRDAASTQQFHTELEQKGISASHLYTVPWCAAWQTSKIPLFTLAECRSFGFLCLLGGSPNKFSYLKRILPFWRSTDPRLTIYTCRQDMADELRNMALPNMEIVFQDLNRALQHDLMMRYRGHLIVSQGEAFGYAAANAEVAGSFTIMNRLPTFVEQYENHPGVAWLSNTYEASAKVRYSLAVPTDTIRSELEAAFQAFLTTDLVELRLTRQAQSVSRFHPTYQAIEDLLKKLKPVIEIRRPSRGVFHCPPLLAMEDCPPITIVTPTYHRKQMIDIAFHNLLATDYPHDKIEWIVIEDNEKRSQLATDKIVGFQVQVPNIRMKYIPIEGRMTIGEKRNLAVEQATNDIILFMDDDDHYPTTSFRRRVAWLTKGVKRGESLQTIVCCTTLALYDLKTGISAVNVPPMHLPFSQRISEATLTFYKSAWEERKFSAVSMAEGESWIEGRENQVIEMPPQQIIVAFSHGTNQSSRRIPPTDQPPSCFWGFPKEYLVFIHGLAGVTVEDAKRK
jgi:Glycosyl transferase family 2